MSSPHSFAQPDSVAELRIEALASDGRGIARCAEGLTIFVEGAFPGQVVLARITSRRKRYAEGFAETLLSPAPDERPAPCIHAGECGGCPWQGLAYAAQLRWKEQIVRDALQRIGHIENPPVRAILPSPAEWRYRNKMSFVFGEDAAGLPALGQRSRRSHTVVNITGCLMQDEAAMRILAIARDAARASGLPAKTNERPDGFWRYIVIRRPRSGKRFADIIVGQKKAGEDAAKTLAESLLASGAADGVTVSERLSPSDLAQGEKTLLTLGDTSPAETLVRPAGCFPTDTPHELELGFDHHSFFQVNTPAAEKLYGEAAALLCAEPVGTLWDLYCGVGGIGLFLAPLAGEVRGVEIVSDAIRQARRNAAKANLRHCRFLAGDAGAAFTMMEETGVTSSTVVSVDPPRAGLAPGVTKKLLQLRPERILYISCDPATLARDVARLAPAYSLREARPVDLFPQTPHVETVCCLYHTKKDFISVPYEPKDADYLKQL